MSRIGCLVLVVAFAAGLLVGCAGLPVLTEPGKRRVAPSPVGKVPVKEKVSGTQRPYKINGRTYYPLPSAEGFVETGIASWYGKKFHGRMTSNGEIYDMHGRTAAHKTLPMHTRLLVKNLENGKEVVTRVNDRGPFVKGRIIDLSYTLAKDLGIDRQGTGRVRITALGEAVVSKQGGRTVQRFLPHQDFEHGEFYVQVGSFSNQENAEKLQDKLTGWGRQAVIQVFDQGDAVFYRVQVRADGTTLSEAKRTERVLTKAGFSEAFVVAR